jgi:hypothetical protein
MRIYSEKLARRFALFALSLACAQTQIVADDFLFFTTPTLIPERGAITGCVVHTQFKKVTFLPPPIWGIDANTPQKKVTMTARDLSASIVCRFLIENRPGETNTLREQIVARYPEARNLQSIDSAAAGEPCVFFEFEIPSAKGLVTSKRLAFVLFDGGWIEIEMTGTGTALTEAWRFAFANLLASLRIEPIRAPPGGPPQRAP